MDYIRLLGMRFYGRHGALAAERELGQRFIIDVELGLDLRAAGESDDLAGTVNYAHVFEQVREVAEGPPYALLESVAEQIARRLLSAFETVTQTRVRVRKPGAPIAGILEAAEVEIVRSRR